MEQNYFTENLKPEKNVAKVNRSVSLSTLIISIITTIVFILIIVSKWPAIVWLVWIDPTSKETVVAEISVWDYLVLTWFVQNDWDITNYTHTIDDVEFGKVGLKSSKVNLNKYSKEVYLEWIVEKLYQGMPIISVDTIYYLDLDDEEIFEEDPDWMSFDSKYLPSLGVFLDSDFFEQYSLINEWSNGILKIKNIETNEIAEINYFNCLTSDNNKNCDRFNEMFKESSSQKFVDSYGVTYYKQPETQSWFFSNDSIFGYFLNDYPDNDGKNLLKAIQAVNQKFVEKNILNKVDLLCWEWWKWIKTVTSSKLYFQGGKLLLDLEWKNDLDLFKCQLELDLNLKNMAKMTSLENLWQVEKEESSDSSSSNWKNEEINYDWTSDVAQFPINLEKSLTFTSRKGFSYTFPSSNIAYSAQNSQEDFSQLWVNCYSVMHVVQYSEKDLVEQNANVKIYECSIKNWFDDSDQKLIYKQVWDRHFVIETIDPAWLQFAHNIAINILD